MSLAPALQQEFEAVLAHGRDIASRLAEDNRRRRVAEHWASLECCWPEWTPEVGGRCEPHSCFAFNITEGGDRYHMMAPCRILEISPDRETYIVEIDYPPGTCAFCLAMNGQRLRLDILNLWAPVHVLHGARYS